MKKKRWLAAAMAILLAVSGMENGEAVLAKEADVERVFWEDFEQENALDGWNITNKTSQTVVELQERNENHVLYVNQNIDTLAQKNLEILHEMEPQTGDLVLSFQVVAEKLTKGAFYLPTFYSGSQRLMEIAFNYSGTLSYKPADGELQYVDGFQYEAMRWYQIQQVYHVDTKTLDLYVDGELIFEGQAVKTGENENALEINRIAMSSYRKNDGAWFVDDISVTQGSSRPSMDVLPDLEETTEESTEAETEEKTDHSEETESIQETETSPESGEETLYEENFSGDTGLDASWSIANRGTAQIAVEHHGENDVLVVKQDGNEKSMTLRRQLGETDTGMLYFSYSVAAANDSSGSVYLPTFFGNGKEIVKLQMAGSSSLGGMFKYQPTGQAAKDLGVAFVPMQWYTIQLIYDTKQGTYDLWIDDKQVLDDEPAYQVEIPDQIGFGIYKDTSNTYYLDNWTVTTQAHEPIVPEELPKDSGESDEEEITYEEDFSNVEEGKLPAGWSVSNVEGKTEVAVAKEEENAVLKISHPAVQSVSMTAKKPLAGSASKGVLRYMVKAEDTNGSLYLPTFYSDTKQLAKLTMNSGKFQYDKDGAWKDIIEFESGRWYEIEIVMDQDAGVYDLYLDGKLILKKEEVDAQGSINRVGFGVYKNTVNTYYLDDISISNYVEAQSASLAEDTYVVGKGKEIQIGLSMEPADASNRTAQWESEDESIVSVNELGVITGVEEGTCTITAISDATGEKMSAQVTVQNKKAEEIVVSSQVVSVKEGSYIFIEANVMPEDANNQEICFVSENESIASIDGYGEIHGVSEGTTTIWAMAEEDNTVRTAIEVTVEARGIMEELYVSPSGNDASDGLSPQNAVQTLPRVQELVRSRNQDMTGDIVVHLAFGYYNLSQTFALTEADSGTNGYFVRFEGPETGEVQIGGMRSITGWREYENGIYVADAPGLETRQLFVDQVRATRARSEGGLKSAVQWKNGTEYVGFYSENTEFLSYRHPQDIEFVFQEQWTNSRCQVAKVEEAEDGRVAITMDQPGWTYCADKGLTSATTPIYYENALELLDEPGEWYLDTEEGKIYYMPRPWEQMDQVQVTAPVLEELVTVMGSDYDHMVRNISFRNITFADTTWNRPSSSNGHADSQNNHIREHGISDYLADAAVTVKRANTILFSDCTFTRLGIIGLKMVEGVQNSTIQGNRFFDISGDAICIGDPYTNVVDNYNPSDLRKMMKNNDVLNNYIHDIGVDYQSSAAISVGFADYMDMKYNEIFNIPYSGFHIGYGWAKRFENVQRNMHIEHNFIHDLMGDGIYDGGAFYTIGNSGGTAENPNTVMYNYVRNQMDLNAPLYSDEGTTYWDFAHNVIDLTETEKWHNNSDPRFMLVYVTTIEHLHVFMITM